MYTGHVTLLSGWKDSFLVAVDYFTKWSECQPDSSETGVAVTVCLQEEIIKRHGCPKCFLTDNESPYCGQAIQVKCSIWEIYHHTLANYHPEISGMT